MSRESHQRLRKLFEDALERPEAERLSFVKAACGGETDEYQAVARLLQAHEPAQSFLETPAPGADRIGRYLITGELGRGAMGVVYEAVDPLIDRKVALKVIHLTSLADRSEAGFLRDRLFREARSAGQLLHPGIVILFDVGQEGDLAYITMERVNGLSLQRILGSGRKLERREIIGLLRETASALDYAHQKGVVHCDVKPGNIIMDKAGPAKLADFGIAKIASAQYHTRSGLLMGTPAYMSPEHIEGKPLDGRSDQFSLAVVAFELLTGRTPFQGETIAGMAYTIVHTPTPSARSLNPELPVKVDQALMRGLSKQPADRFASCAGFVDALEAGFERGPILGAPALPPVQPRVSPAPAPAPAPVPAMVARPSRKASIAAWIFAGAALVALAGVAIYYRQLPATSAPKIASTAPVVSTPENHPQPRTSAPSAELAVARFTADAATIKTGSSTKLHWDVKGASKVAITPGIGTVAASGSADVKPAESTVYRLTATGADGRSISQSVRLAVDNTPDAAAILAKAEAEKQAGNLQSALTLFHQAADLGEPRAMEELGHAADSAKNYSEASQWFREAADRGNAAAMRMLGGMYYLGQGVPQEASSAAYWFGKASDAGDAAGKFDLGMLYENGTGVPKDMGKAQQLYRDAAALGNEEARRRLQR